MLRRQAVVRRAEVGGQAEAVVLDVGPGAGPDAEAAAVEVEEHRQAVLAPVPGPVQPERLVELHGPVVPHRRRETRLRPPHHRAVAVHEQHAPALVHHVRCRRRGRLGRHA